MNSIKIVLFIFTTFFVFSKVLPSYAIEDNYYSKSKLESILFNIDYEEVKNTFSLNLVHVIYGGDKFSILTNRSSISLLLYDVGIIIDNNSRVISTSENVENNMIIRVITKGTIIETHREYIPYISETIDSTEIDVGERKVIQKGVLGVRKVEIKKIYEDGELISKTELTNEIQSEPIKEIVAIGVLMHSPDDVEQRGYNCDFWYGVVDQMNFTAQEKQWLKLVMKCESGCNAENNRHRVYKGLFQWHPRYWYREFPEDNIFDGFAQINNAIFKIRNGVQMGVYWPACHRRYVATYGEYIQ